MNAFTSHSGFSLPPLGFGTVRLRGDSGAEAIGQAIDAGYRLLDTAFNYENEGSVGRAVRHAVERGVVTRDEIIVTSKLPGRHHTAPLNVQSVEESRARLGLDRIDLHLIHWPNPQQGEYVDAWQGLIEAKARDVVREIGVSNFLPEHLERIEDATGARPVVNQIEVHPYFPQEEIVAVHRELGIITEAWSPLGRGEDVLSEPVILEIARTRSATPAQVILAWHRARGVVAIPRSSSPERQRENLESLELTLDDGEVTAITALGRADGRLFGGDPRHYEES